MKLTNSLGPIDGARYGGKAFFDRRIVALCLKELISSIYLFAELQDDAIDLLHILLPNHLECHGDENKVSSSAHLSQVFALQLLEAVHGQLRLDQGVKGLLDDLSRFRLKEENLPLVNGCPSNPRKYWRQNKKEKD